LRNLIRLAGAAALAFLLARGAAASYAPSVADLDAEARAVGNRRDVALRVGEAIFSTRWSAQVTQISANQLGTHLIVGIRLWGVRFHHTLTRAEFIDEVLALTARTFATAPSTEEIDVWASVPIEVGKGVIVNGDLAKPTSRTVFSLTVRRAEAPAELRSRAERNGDGAYWDADWSRVAFKQPS
jgi:hypothetical protein